MAYNTAAYVWNEGGPGCLKKNIADIQASGLTTVILDALHVGRKMDEHPDMKIGDLIYNDYPEKDLPQKDCLGNLLVSDGKFNPNNSSEIEAWPAQVAQLKQQGSVSKVFMCIGGEYPKVLDFTTIQNMINANMTQTLIDNFGALKEAFTVNGVCTIDGFDLDCEEPDIELQTFFEFSRMLFGFEFEVTFCPYDRGEISDWQKRMKCLWDKGMKVSWWNLQCYSGGSGNRNNLQPWIDALAAVVGKDAAPSFLMPGLAVEGVEDTTDGQCPFGDNSIFTTFKGWNNPRLAGGFLWKYDALVKHPDLCSGNNNLASYVKAINDALANKKSP